MSSSLLLSNLNFCAASSTSVDLLFGGDLDETVAGIIQTDDDGYVIAGTTYSFGEGDGDFWLIKLDPKGTSHMVDQKMTMQKVLFKLTMKVLL